MKSDELDRFINEILDEKQLSGVTPEVRVQLVADLKERLLDQINRALITALPDDKMTEFNTLLDDETISDDAVTLFIAGSGVDVQKVTIQTMLRFSELYLGRPGSSGKAA